jgi:molecular chaperone GrpE
MGSSSSKADIAQGAERERQLRAAFERQLQAERVQAHRAGREQAEQAEANNRTFAIAGGCALLGLCGLGAVHSLRLARMLAKERSYVAKAKERLVLAGDEVESVRAIAARDAAQARQYAITSFAKGLLDVADNLERAIEATGGLASVDAEAQPQLHTLLQGVEMTDAQLHKAFGEHKLAKFGAVGDAFDADLHEAMFEVPASDDAAPGSVALVVKQGYRLDDRVIRWAQVGTAVAKEEK